MTVLYIPSKRATTLVIKIKSEWLASQFVSQSTNFNLLFCYLLSLTLIEQRVVGWKYQHNAAMFGLSTGTNGSPGLRVLVFGHLKQTGATLSGDHPGLGSKNRTF